MMADRFWPEGCNKHDLKMVKRAGATTPIPAGQMATTTPDSPTAAKA